MGKLGRRDVVDKWVGGEGDFWVKNGPSGKRRSFAALRGGSFLGQK